MKAVRENESTGEVRMELKYCERCGGLWLRPTDGGQIYCAACGRAMAELPPASYDRVGGPRLSQGPRWEFYEGEDESDEGYEGLDLDAAGGVA
jgi:hypothetical protein